MLLRDYGRPWSLPLSGIGWRHVRIHSSGKRRSWGVIVCKNVSTLRVSANDRTPMPAAASVAAHSSLLPLPGCLENLLLHQPRIGVRIVNGMYPTVAFRLWSCALVMRIVEVLFLSDRVWLEKRAKGCSLPSENCSLDRQS